MGRKGTVKADPRVRAEVDAALQRGCSYDEIVDKLRAMGSDVSRSAVGRYAKDYAALASQQRDMKAVAQAFGKEFGEADDLQGRLMIQLLTSVITRAVMPIATGEEVDLDGKDLHFLARAVKDVTSAAKTDVDRETKIREEEAKRARLKAAKDAEVGARAAGASDDTIRMVRAAILGIDP